VAKCGKLIYQMLISFSSPRFSVKDVFNYGAVVRLHHVHRNGEPQAEIMQAASHSMTVNLGGGGGGLTVIGYRNDPAGLL
jgi:hypothetical protein